MANMFDENGNYNKTEWKPGDRITAGKLNKIEESLEAINNNDIERHKEADERLDALEEQNEAVEERFDELEDLVADNKSEVDTAIYEVHSKMDRLEQEMNDGIDTVEAIAHTVDDKIAAADASMKTQVNQGKDDMAAMVAEVEGELEGINEQLAYKENKRIDSIKISDLGAKDGEDISRYVISAFNNEKVKTVVVDIDGIIDNTIVVPKNCTLDLSESRLVVNNNIDCIVINDRYSTVKNGYIENKCEVFNKAIILLTGSPSYSNIENVDLYSYPRKGCGIEFRMTEEGCYTSFNTLTNFKIFGFEIGLYINVINKDTINPSRYVTCSKIHGFIASSNQCLRVDNHGNVGSIQGLDIFIRGQAGIKGMFDNTFNEAIYLDCFQSTINVICDDAGVKYNDEYNYVDEFVTFGVNSQSNTYLGVDERVIDKGKFNMILNAEFNSPRQFMLNVHGTSADELGYINNCLFNADKRFTVTHDVINGSPYYNSSSLFSIPGDNAPTVYRTDQSMDMIVTTKIVFDTAKRLTKFIVKNANSMYEYTKIRVKRNGLWYETKEFKKKIVCCNTYDLCGGATSIEELEIISRIEANSSVTALSIEAIQGFGFGEKSNFMSKNGGIMYGDLEFSMPGFNIILKSSDGSRFRLKINNDGTIITEKQ